MATSLSGRSSERLVLTFLKKMSLKTYGDRPISFQLEENGEFYCIGSEVKKKIIFAFTDQILIIK